jgi:natural resistance-associated macrophage protein
MHVPGASMQAGGASLTSAAVGAGVSDRSHEHVAAAVKTIGRTHEDYANLGTVHVACGADYDHRNPHAIKFSWRKLWLYTGPGLLVSMAYLDPGNLTSDLQQGAYTQYQLLWVLWWSTVVGWLLQVLAARIGFTTGKDLAEVCREEMPRWACLLLFAQMELAIIGTDIQEVLGSAIAIKILFGVPLWGGCLITAVSTFAFLAIQRYGVRLLEAFFAGFIGVMAVCFMINWGEASSPAAPFVEGWVVPKVSSYALLQAVGIVGAVIMPHNLYLHSGLVLSRNIDREHWAPPSPSRSCTACRSGGAAVHMVAEGNYYNAVASALALFVSFFINAAIVATFAASFYDANCAALPGGPYGCVAVDSVIRASCQDSSVYCSKAGSHMNCLDGSAPGPLGCSSSAAGACTFPDTGKQAGVCAQIGLLLAGDALHSSMGSAASFIWAIGLLAAGQAATITATYAGQFVFSGFIKLQLPMWTVMLITRGFALGPSVVIALIAGNNPGVSATMNEWLNTLQSFQLPFALLPAMLVAHNKRIMGEFVTPLKWQIITWILAILLLAVNTYFMVSFLADPTEPVPRTAGFNAFLVLYGLVYYGFIGYMCRHELVNFFYFVTGNPKRQDSMIGTPKCPEESECLLPKAQRAWWSRGYWYGTPDSSSSSVNT